MNDEAQEATGTGTADRLVEGTGASSPGYRQEHGADQLGRDVPSAAAAPAAQASEQRDRDARLTTAVRAALIASGITSPNDAWFFVTSPNDAWYLDSDAIRLVEELRVEGYAIEPLPVPATPVDAAPAPPSHAKPEAPVVPAVPGQVTW